MPSVYDNNKMDDVLEDGNLMVSVFNEMSELKHSFRTIKCSVLSLFGLVIALTVFTMGASFATLKQSKSLYVDENTFRLATAGSDGPYVGTVGTIGIGQSFRLPMYTFPLGSYDDVNQSHPNPFVCVGVPSVVKLWRSAFLGITTNVVVAGAFEGRYIQGESEDGVAEFGVSLTWQGSTQNRTHACLSTLDKNLQICVNFATTFCGAGSERVTSVVDHFDERRKLFSDLVDPNTLFDMAPIDVDAGEGMVDLGFPNPSHRMMKECTFGNWCKDFASLELVGRW